MDRELEIHQFLPSVTGRHARPHYNTSVPTSLFPSQVYNTSYSGNTGYEVRRFLLGCHRTAFHMHVVVGRPVAGLSAFHVLTDIGPWSLKLESMT